MAENYSSIQKLSLAGIVIAGILVAVGGGAPYWIVFEPSAPGSLGTILGIASQVVDAYMGLYMSCLELLGEKKCELVTTSEDDGWFHTIRVTGAVSIGVSVLCGFASLCLACCTCCRRLIALGLFAAFASACGGFTAGIFAKKTEIFTSSVAGVSFSNYGWAFWVYCSGVGLIGICSFAACFASPDTPPGGTVIGQVAPAGQVISVVSAQQGAYYQQPMQQPWQQQQQPQQPWQQQPEQQWQKPNTSAF